MADKKYSVPVQENGRMILPAELRKELELGKGDRIIIETHGDTIALSTPRRSRRRAQELFRRYVPAGRDLVDDVIADRRAECARESDREDRSAGEPTDRSGS